MNSKSKSTTFLLCYFLGTLGVHRFYLNKVLSGILMLLTGGGLGIWWMIDLYQISRGRMQDKQGDDLYSGPPDPDNSKAGFWVRVAAFSVDGILLELVLLVVIAIPIGIATFLELEIVFEAMVGMNTGDPVLAMIPVLLALVISLLYFAYPLTTQHQATPGKRCFDIYVTTKDDEPVGLLRALWRTCSYGISAIPLYFGFFMAGFKNKRGLHDMLAGTQVLYVTDAGGGQLSVADADVASEAVTETEAASGSGSDTGANADPASTRGPLIMMVLGIVLLGAAAALALL